MAMTQTSKTPPTMKISTPRTVVEPGDVLLGLGLRLVGGVLVVSAALTNTDYINFIVPSPAMKLQRETMVRLTKFQLS